MPPNRPSNHIVAAFNAKYVTTRMVFVGTHEWIITIPSWYRSREGFTQKKVQHFIGKKTIQEVVQGILSNKQLTLERIKEQLLALEIPDTKIIDLKNDIDDFKISNTWLNKSITIKIKGHWKPLCFLGKDAGFIKQFYNK